MYLSEVVGKGNIRARVVEKSVLKGFEDTPLITFELRYPRLIHAELMTHRVFSRNASSSRAIPVETIMKQIEEQPAMPIHWGMNKAGMQAAEEWDFDDGGEWNPQYEWRAAAKSAVVHGRQMSEMGIHKQVANRICEPFQFINVVVTSTEWSNWYALRDHKDAQPEIAELARMMIQANEQAEPTILQDEHWHLPYITEVDYQSSVEMEDLVKASAARCARVSYMKHDKSSPSIEDDLMLYNMLAVRPFDSGNGHILGVDDPVHLSPLEHQATVNSVGCVSSMDMPWPEGYTHMDRDRRLWSGNFRSPWIQYRQIFWQNNGD